MYVKCKAHNGNTSITISKGLAQVMDDYLKNHQEYRSRSEIAVHAIHKLIDMNNHINGVGSCG